MIASTVEATMPIRIAPFTLRAYNVTISSRPKTKTRTGQPRSSPALPSSTGGPSGAAGRRTMPASTSPMNAMNRPMPTLIAIFSCSGTASNTAFRNPVSTSTRMTRPSSTTRPIASAQVILVAIENATNAFSPNPVASASGKFARTPMRMVTTPATSAVATATFAIDTSGLVPPPTSCPSPSLTVPMISGFSTTM